jgi:hypothetical protein
MTEGIGRAWSMRVQFSHERGVRSCKVDGSSCDANGLGDFGIYLAL